MNFPTLGRKIRPSLASIAVVPLAIAASVSIVSRVPGVERMAWNQLLTPIGICAITLCFALYLPIRHVIHLQQNLGMRRLLRLVLFAGLAGVVWLFASPSDPAPGDATDVAVTVLAGNAEKAKGREVWLRLERDGKDVPSSELKQTGQWLDKAPFLVAVNPPAPTSVLWHGSYSSSLRLVFVSHAWSGRARVTWNGYQKDLDLYSANGDSVSLDLAGLRVASNRHFGRDAHQWFITSCDALVIGALALTLLVWLVMRNKTSTLTCEAPQGPLRETPKYLAPPLPFGGKPRSPHPMFGVLTGRQKPSTVAIAMALGPVLSIALLFSWPRFNEFHPTIAIALFVITTGLLTALAWAILLWTHIRWSTVALRVRLLWLLSFTLVGWLLTWMIPLDPAPSNTASVEIESLAKRSPSSKGSEVWIRLLVDGRAVELDEVNSGPTWTSAHGYLIAPTSNRPDRIRWSGHYSDNIYLEFLTHEWSGKAVARWGGKIQQFDLYSATGGGTSVLLAGKPGSSQFLLLPSRTPLQYFVQACQSFALGLLLLAVLTAAARWPSPSRQDSVSPQFFGREVLTAALPLLMIGSVLLVIFLPAILTTDSLNQWNQAATGVFDDAHPVLFAFYLWLIQQVLPSTTLAVWLQMVAMAFASGWLATVVRRACNAPRWTSWIGGALLAAYPLTSLSSITLWKDVPYASSVVALTAFVIGNVFIDRPSLHRWYNCLALVLLAAACMALRHNGPPVAVAALLILMIRPGTRLRALICLMLTVGTMWSIKGPIADSVGTHRTSAAYMVFTHHLSAHLAAGQTPDSAADAALLDAINNGKNDWRYRCSLVNSTIFDNSYDIPAAVEHQSDLFRIWFNMALERPDVELDHVLCASGMIWRYRTSSPLYLYVFGFEQGEGKSLQWVQPGLGGPPQASPVPKTAWRIGHAVLKSKYTHLWRPAPFLAGLCLLTVLACLRSRDKRILLIPTLVLIHSAVLMLAIIAQDARYQLPLYIVFLVTAPALMLARHREPTAADVLIAS